MNDKLTLGYDQSPSLQIGRTVINFSLSNKGHSSNGFRQISSLQTEPSKKVSSSLKVFTLKEDEYDITNDKPIKFTIPKKESSSEIRTNIFDEKNSGKDLSPKHIQSSEDESNLKK